MDIFDIPSAADSFILVTLYSVGLTYCQTDAGGDYYVWLGGREGK